MRDFTLFDLFSRNARISADDEAIVAGDYRRTFSRLHEDCEQLARGLTGKGVMYGDRVAVLALNQPGFFVLFGALVRLGAVIVPLNRRLSRDELEYIVRDTEAKLVFADRNHLDIAREIAVSAGTEAVELTETGAPENWLSDKPAGEETITGETPCCIFYTAAVDGHPRGAVLSHNNLLSANLQVIGSMGLNRQDVNLAMLPLFHITGLNLALAVMQVGGRNVVIERFNEEETLKLTETEQVTLWGSFPPILQRLTTEIGKNKHDVSSLKFVVGLDGPDNIASFEQATGARFWILYGQAETSGFVTFSPASDAPGTAGRQGLISNYILVDETDHEVPPGEIGEIAVRGPLVFKGYWRKEEANRHTFRNGWHHTGDFGQHDENGNLIFKGRKPEKELIKPGGENVYPAEVEAVILQHPAVESVSVIGVPDKKFGEGVKAVCVLRRGESLEAESLIEFVGSRIARYKKPGYVQFVDKLPMNGETIDRLKVKELYG